eukprot:CAMPEP_0196739344 /NCGR_PEP_ID=MMETSP1091-20130531/21831_1 /TAXON_ID=302021 /ORGANISM="Rhodomonas sp., Strain CCMP768" /LENGTH=91 /DNA_ID=CAMNT_0042083827 /DNA_START=211 /DNA_END=484 /DNA_ORIENTATION=-
MRKINRVAEVSGARSLENELGSPNEDNELKDFDWRRATVCAPRAAQSAKREEIRAMEKRVLFILEVLVGLGNAQFTWKVEQIRGWKTWLQW